MILSWIDVGLKSDLSEVRVRTLQGILFIIQTMNGDDLQLVLSFIHQFIVNELEIRRPGVDPINMSVLVYSFLFILVLILYFTFNTFFPVVQLKNFQGNGII